MFLFVGSYTDGEKKEGIYVYEFDLANGELKEVEREGNLINPSFLAISDNGKYLYACTETRLQTPGSVSAFQIDTLTGKITFLNKQSAGGRNPVHLAVDKNNQYVVNSSYTDAGVSIFKTDADGRLNPYSKLLEFGEGSNIVEGRQEESHVHSAHFSPDDEYLFAPDLGADKIRAFTFDESDQLIQVENLDINTQAGSGPRHFTFHPNHKFAYSIEEISGQVVAYRYLNGQLDLIDSYFAYSKEHEVYSSADIHISPDGKFLYASNRLTEENTIAIFKIDQNTGQLVLVGHQSTFGDHPRNFVIDPTGAFLLVANMNSGNIVVFKRDQKSGLLTKTASEIQVEKPSSLQMRQYGK
ncbi:MAG: lactonase family protein [Saprospiraceae bacterium]